MFATFRAPAEIAFPRFSPKTIGMGIVASIGAADARARARRDYERLLGSEAAMRDVGLRSEDVRRAMNELDGQS